MPGVASIHHSILASTHNVCLNPAQDRMTLRAVMDADAPKSATDRYASAFMALVDGGIHGNSGVRNNRTCHIMV
ncbi:hypothetical protein MTO96_041060, partial [Rhipicephalus appendiculatus]